MNTVDKLHEAVESAIDEGLTPEKFVREAWTAWEEVLDEKRRFARIAFERLLTNER